VLILILSVKITKDNEMTTIHNLLLLIMRI